SRLVNPEFAAAVDLSESHPDDLAGPHACQPLESDHRRDGRRQERQQRFDVFVDYRLDRLSLSRLGPPVTQAGNSLECMEDVARKKLLTDRPLEDTFDAAHSLIDNPAAIAIIDELLLDCLQRSGAEFASERAAVQFSQRSERFAYAG